MKNALVVWTIVCCSVGYATGFFVGREQEPEQPVVLTLNRALADDATAALAMCTATLKHSTGLYADALCDLEIERRRTAECQGRPIGAVRASYIGGWCEGAWRE